MREPEAPPDNHPLGTTTGKWRKSERLGMSRDSIHSRRGTTDPTTGLTVKDDPRDDGPCTGDRTTVPVLCSDHTLLY